MNKRLMFRALFAILIPAVIAITVNYKMKIPPYKISLENVKSIRCLYCDQFGGGNVPVDDSDKKIIIAEVSKMDDSGIQGVVGTLGYNFLIELVNGSVFTFIENGPYGVTLQTTRFSRNIKAPETRKFIDRFLSEHNISNDW